MERTYCHPVSIVTPKQYILDGLWFGGRQPKRAIVFVHGLSSSAFAHHSYLASLSDNNTAVIYFSNRGHDKVARIRRINKRSKKGYVQELAGEAHEVFTDCADDIQGVVDLLLRKGVKDIYLVGHSTGCQKVAYYLSRTGKQKKIRGAVLLCPVSDYANAKKITAPKKLKKAQILARKMIKAKQPHAFLPKHIWPDLLDAQRFLSLHTPESQEEIFTYAQPGKIPRTLERLTLPLLIVLAGKDEYHDRPARDIMDWFKKNVRSKKSAFSIIANAGHTFRKHEKKLTAAIGSWLSKDR